MLLDIRSLLEGLDMLLANVSFLMFSTEKNAFSTIKWNKTSIGVHDVHGQMHPNWKS